MKKRFLTGLLVLVMVLTLLPTMALADTTGENETGVASVNGTSYATLEAAIAAAEPTNGVITYEISGKADVNATGWVQVLKSGLENITKVEFKGITDDAEICITGGLAILADQQHDIDVSFENLKLSKLNPTYGGDYGHSTNYFTCWLRNKNQSENTVTYKNCTFPNGVCNNQYGKTVYDNCHFANEASGKYNLWVYGGEVEVTGSSFTGTRGMKVYTEAKASENPTIEVDITDTTFTGLTEKAAIVVSKPGNVDLSGVSVTDCEKGFFQKDLEGSTGEQVITISANGTQISGEFNISSDKTPSAVKNEFQVSGGSFTEKLEEDWCKEGYAPTEQNEDGTYGVAAENPVAKIGTVGYPTLAAAIDAAQDGDTITLLDDINIGEGTGTLLNITKSITLDGDNHSITGYAIRGNNYAKNTIAVNYGGTEKISVTLKDLTVNCSAPTEPGFYAKAIETRGNVEKLTLDHVTINCTGTGNVMGLVLGGSASNGEKMQVDVLNQSNITTANAGYPVLSYIPVTMNVANSTVSGYCGFYLKEDSGTSVLTCTDATITATNAFDGDDNTFGAIVLEDDDITVNLVNCKVDATATGSAGQSVLLVSEGTAMTTGFTLNISGANTDVKGELVSLGDSDLASKANVSVSAGTFDRAVPSDYCADGYVPKQNEDGSYGVTAATSIDLAAFRRLVAASGYNFDGASLAADGKKLVVEWSPVSGCFQTGTHNCTANSIAATGNTPDRENSALAQYQLFKGVSDVTIKNVRFVYKPADFTICANSGWATTRTAEQVKSAQLYLLNSNNTTIEGCEFDHVVFTSFDNTGETTIKDCAFKDIDNSFAIKDLGGSKVSVTGTTFENCGGGIMLDSNTSRTVTPSTVEISGNSFTNVDTASTSPTDKAGTRGLVRIPEKGSYADSDLTLDGNTATGCGPTMSQLNNSAIDMVENLTGDLTGLLDENGALSFTSSSVKKDSNDTPSQPTIITIAFANCSGVGSMKVTDGTSITLPTASKSGYTFDGWFQSGTVYAGGASYLVDSANATDGTITFTAMWTKIKHSSGSGSSGSSSSKPAAKPAEPDTSFVDVSSGAWYADAVEYAVKNGLMNGTGANRFSPNAATTRGMIVTILARMEGVNTDGTPWYAAGRRWAMEAGVSDGTNMEAAITREQLAAMLFRYAVKHGMDAVTLSENLSSFSDASSVSSWAVPAMQWAVGQGLIQGSNGLLRPQATASRAEVATILMRFCELLKK